VAPWSILDRSLLGNSVVGWAIALTVVVTVAVGLRGTLGFVGRRLAGAGEGTIRAFLASLILAARNLFVVSLALLAGASTLELPAAPAKLVRFAAVTIMIVQIGLWSTKLFGFALERWMTKDGRADPASVTVASLLRFVGHSAVWILVLLLVLDNAGVDVTALVAGLGVGGIAVALAVQNILGDLFASLSIVVDRPFVVGDFIRVGDLLGTVERIGLKSTRLRSLTGEQLVVANSDLLSSRIHNFQRLQERRIAFGFGVLYETSPEHLRAVPGIVREVVSAEPKARFDRAHLKGFGASSLDYEVVYFVLEPDYTLFMDVQERINLGLITRLAALQVGFAYPTHTVHLHAPPTSPGLGSVN